MSGAAAESWLAWDPNAETKHCINELVEKGDTDELENRLGKRLAFGTAGLRGPMGAGTNCMNDLVVLQTTQGVCSYLEQQYGDKLKTMGIALGYDHRSSQSLSSLEFAKYIAAVFVSRGVRVYMFSTFVPTPFVVRNSAPSTHSV